MDNIHGDYTHADSGMISLCKKNSQFMLCESALKELYSKEALLYDCLPIESCVHWIATYESYIHKKQRCHALDAITSDYTDNFPNDMKAHKNVVNLLL